MLQISFNLKLNEVQIIKFQKKISIYLLHKTITLWRIDLQIYLSLNGDYYHYRSCFAQWCLFYVGDVIGFFSKI